MRDASIEIRKGVALFEASAARAEQPAGEGAEKGRAASEQCSENVATAAFAMIHAGREEGPPVIGC